GGEKEDRRGSEKGGGKAPARGGRAQAGRTQEKAGGRKAAQGSRTQEEARGGKTPQGSRGQKEVRRRQDFGTAQQDAGQGGAAALSAARRAGQDAQQGASARCPGGARPAALGQRARHSGANHQVLRAVEMERAWRRRIRTAHPGQAALALQSRRSL